MGAASERFVTSSPVPACDSIKPTLARGRGASLPLKPELKSHLEYYCPGVSAAASSDPKRWTASQRPAQQKYLTPHPSQPLRRVKEPLPSRSFVAPTASPASSSDERKLLPKINIRPCVCGGLRQKQGPSIVLCEYRQKHEHPSSHRNERTSLTLVSISDAAFGPTASLVLPSPPSQGIRFVETSHRMDQMS